MLPRIKSCVTLLSEGVAKMRTFQLSTACKISFNY